MTYYAIITGADDWSRVKIRLPRGLELCDTNCHDADVLAKNPELGDWHTFTKDWGEPIAAINDDVKICIVESFEEAEKQGVPKCDCGTLAAFSEEDDAHVCRHCDFIHHSDPK